MKESVIDSMIAAARGTLFSHTALVWRQQAATNTIEASGYTVRITEREVQAVRDGAVKLAILHTTADGGWDGSEYARTVVLEKIALDAKARAGR